MSGTGSSSAGPKEMLRALLILFAAMVIGVFMFMLIAVFINQVQGPFLPDWEKYQSIITWMIAAGSLICLVVAWKAFSKGMSAAKNSLNPLIDKLGRYRSSLILYLAICEAPALTNIIMFILIGNFVFLVFASILLGFMLAVAPIRRRVIAALELDWQQAKEFD